MPTTDIDRYAKPGHEFTYRSWFYEFPNGHRASIIVDWRTPFRFEIQAPEAVAGPGGILAGLTSEQVEAKLAEISALPDTNPDA